MKSMLKRIGTALLACLMLAALCLPAMAVDIDEARASVAEVKLTQYYNGIVRNAVQHNFAESGGLRVEYTAELSMTELMATYLQAREQMLLGAEFVVHIDLNSEGTPIDDLFKLSSDKSVMTFSSNSMKPVGDFGKPEYKDGVYTYSIPLAAFWNSKTVTDTGAELQLPAELILYGDRENAYGFSDLYEDGVYVGTVDGSKKPLYYDFEVSDWMQPITLGFGQFEVKDSAIQAITEEYSTWKRVTVSGTIDGKFEHTYEPFTISEVCGYHQTGYYSRLGFGTEESGIDAWKSNEVLLILCSYQRGNEKPVNLNTKDHYAYIIGYPEGDVRPNNSITRAEVATIYFRMLTDESRNANWATTNSFSDVNEGDWFNNAVSTLTNLGILSGYPDGTFRPNAPITRAEYASIAARFFEILTDETAVDAFTDISGHWARENINLAYELKLVSGYPDGTFKPQANILRSEAMTIVNNTLRRSPVKEKLLPAGEMVTWVDNMDTNAWYYATVQEATNSHDYTREADGTETWTKILPVRDWAKLEKEWSAQNAAAVPGEVIDKDVTIGR